MQLDPVEIDVLLEALDIRLRELVSEILHTDAREYRHELRRREVVLRRLRDRLDDERRMHEAGEVVP
jgi:hypothetical protein